MRCLFVPYFIPIFPTVGIHFILTVMSSEQAKKDEAKSLELGSFWNCRLGVDSFIHDDLIIQSITEKGLTDPNRLERISVSPFCIPIIL